MLLTAINNGKHHRLSYFVRFPVLAHVANHPFVKRIGRAGNPWTNQHCTINQPQILPAPCSSGNVTGGSPCYDKTIAG